MRSRPRRRPGLRARSSAAFGVLGLFLSMVLAGATYERTRSYLLEQRESIAITQAAYNARQLSAALLAADDDPARVLASVVNLNGSAPLLLRNERWYVTSANIAPDDLPAPLRRRSIAGSATRQRFALRSEPQLAVAIPLTIGAKAPTVYVEVFPLTELQRTLTTLSATLGAAASVTTVAAALLGLVASRRILRPLASITEAARRVGAGDLDARLSSKDDPDLHELVTTFNLMTESVQHTVDRERRFASDVGHELRSPLTSLRGALSLATSRSEDLPERNRLGLELLDDEVTRFERMTLDLLEMATIDAGAARTELVACDAQLLVTSALRHLGIDVPVELRIDPRRATVNVDPWRFERVVDNLATNAVRHAGGITSITMEERDGRVEIHVDDAGPGIPAGERSMIFERFARGATGRHRPGAGLGLALVREHLRLMHADIDVSDSPQGGARFTVSFPEPSP